MVENLTIRKATEMDLKPILALYAQKDMNNGLILKLSQAEKIFHKFRLYPDYSLYVALMGDDVAGTFELLIMENLANSGKPSGIVEDVVVDEKYRLRGIGKQMMEYAMKICKESNCYKLSLSSNLKREGAHIFYEKLGFSKHGISFLIEL